ncbi:MAG: DUF255 domain-containing protein [Bacteroidetes bacterium]|nr:DUF255 domain-containing protein [Bacteroidota bacterium]
MRKQNTGIKILLIGMLFLVRMTFVAYATDDKPGIHFRALTFEQALAAAKAENKPLFIHGFADWCHYCEYMKDSVYPDKEVGEYYNSHFVCIKMDMEKEGKELNKTIKSHTFPTFLFFDTNGELMHRAAGRRYKNPFLDLAQEALEPRRQMRTFKKKYDSGTASPYEVQFYFRMMETSGMDAQLLLSDYLGKQPDSTFTNANNWKIFYDIMKDPMLPVMRRILGNKKALESIYTADSINNKLINLYNSYLTQFVQMLDSAGYEKAKQQVRRTNGLDIADKICAFADLNKLKMKSEWTAYQTEGKKFVEHYAMNDPKRLIDVAGVFYEHFNSDKEMMSLAEQWLQQSVKLADRYKANHLLASVQFILGKKEQALVTANHAVEVAKRDNNDYRQTTQLIVVIQKAQ